MKHFILFLIFCFLTLSVRAQDFIPGTEDIPLMKNLIIDENETVSFDTPAGQIMNVTAKTTETISNIRTFYNDTLSAIGWQKINSNSYKRGQDTILISTTKNGANTIVKFQITIPNN